MNSNSAYPEIYLETPRLILRQTRPDDFANLKDLDSDPEVMRFLTDGVPSSDEQVREGLERCLSYVPRYEGRFGVFPTLLKTQAGAAVSPGHFTAPSAGEFIGWFILRPDKKDPENLKDLELGYRLKRKFWRQGLALEGSRALIEKAFTEYEAKSVWAKTMKGNAGSWGVMKKLGMHFECEYEELEFSGGDKVGVRYRLTREQWASAAK